MALFQRKIWPEVRSDLFVKQCVGPRSSALASRPEEDLPAEIDHALVRADEAIELLRVGAAGRSTVMLNETMTQDLITELGPPDATQKREEQNSDQTSHRRTGSASRPISNRRPHPGSQPSSNSSTGTDTFETYFDAGDVAEDATDRSSRQRYWWYFSHGMDILVGPPDDTVCKTTEHGTRTPLGTSPHLVVLKVITHATLRPSGPRKRSSTMRPPPVRPGAIRAQTATPTLTGRALPTESMAPSKSRTPKRKAASEMDDAGQETNINVVVRCRGRNDREVRENSGVVVSTEGVKGKKVELSMGPSALSNKTYQFDKVFSPAADQGMIFEEVVVPILDEVLAGFNCTMFAYGQTGTGKTYTMSGDIADTLPIPDTAGIIPRALHSLFAWLSEEDAEKCEYSVKCSFIELYNEELRDPLAADGSSKLKIFDEQNKNGRSTTLVQGVEESHIKSAPNGIRLLREGSPKRQVAATQCSDLSSRSHTVFAVTVYMKRTADTGEEFVSAGKLNLVDLAGSENIQRSGAENKRAAEAGMINKSLLTLGRVMNALVDKSSHIPYRESKLTRLLQDSLGGRTKTCIIATLSPAKSHLEETISTPD
ncbi:Kinesin- motor protein [Friedmanniomyces endolithicus]|nr:Kinesin- motor protein [Friedmanniomyces endolithicus]